MPVKLKEPESLLIEDQEEGSEYLGLRITKELNDKLIILSKQRHTSKSQTVRYLINKQLSVESAKNDMDFIRQQIREELALQLRPNTDRIMKMLMRIGMMAVTLCYFTSKIIYFFAPIPDHKTHNELMSEAKRNAAAYLSMRDETLNRAYKEFNENNS